MTFGSILELSAFQTLAECAKIFTTGTQDAMPRSQRILSKGEKYMDRTFTKALAAFIFIATAAMTVGATMPQELCHGFLPENNMKIPVGARIRSNYFQATTTGGITEEQFNAVMDRIQKLYAPVIAQQGGVLTINRKWTDPTVNASAEEMGTSWVLNMYGGLARHQETTVEGMALVACHELGHHLGGAPKVQGWFGDDWATNEGGADYFATLKCLRNYFAEDDNASIVAAANLDPFAVGRCQSQFTNQKDVLLCERNLMASNSVARLFMDLHKDPAPPQFATPDTSVVTAMNDDHPATQCRLDTYFNGATCKVDATVGNSKTDYHQGSCVQGTDEFGWRPLCWFKP